MTGMNTAGYPHVSKLRSAATTAIADDILNRDHVIVDNSLYAFTRLLPHHLFILNHHLPTPAPPSILISYSCYSCNLDFKQFVRFENAKFLLHTRLSAPPMVGWKDDGADPSVGWQHENFIQQLDMGLNIHQTRNFLEMSWGSSEGGAWVEETHRPGNSTKLAISDARTSRRSTPRRLSKTGSLETMSHDEEIEDLYRQFVNVWTTNWRKALEPTDLSLLLRLPRRVALYYEGAECFMGAGMGLFVKTLGSQLGNIQLPLTLEWIHDKWPWSEIPQMTIMHITCIRNLF
ncbi:hypothetical protein A0H81_10590 [Grifola frondosa]|uniref:Uncharacterized protein n=1 Tax=Grifola frondosa TaxID=5627 RepID=A0A1C7M3J1_GRIFR|nr:hypothetical protein A0H81_10590 [Grifola frondosa]